MLVLWKTGAAVFLLMLLGFDISYEYINKGDVEAAQVVESVIALGIAITALVFIAARCQLEGGMDPVTTFLVSLSYAAIELPRGLIPGVLGTAVLLTAFGLLFTAVLRERLEGQSVLGCFAAIIPGPGVVIGGVIILFGIWSRRRRSKVVA
jgi:hypothetical protein